MSRIRAALCGRFRRVSFAPGSSRAPQPQRPIHRSRDSPSRVPLARQPRAIRAAVDGVGAPCTPGGRFLWLFGESATQRFRIPGYASGMGIPNASRVMASGSGPPRMPVSSTSIRVSSSAVSSKPKPSAGPSEALGSTRSFRDHHDPARQRRARRPTRWELPTNDRAQPRRPSGHPRRSRGPSARC